MPIGANNAHYKYKMNGQTLTSMEEEKEMVVYIVYTKAKQPQQ
jgi:hypothetical protein